jgi:hypothetical protein
VSLHDNGLSEGESDLCRLLFSANSLIVLKWNSEAAHGDDRIDGLVGGLTLVLH